MSGFSTKRYDRKTRKDDIRKYTIIAVIIAIAVAACVVGIYQLRKANAPDYTFVDMTYGNLTEEAIGELKSVIGDVVGDKNQSGTVHVGVKSLDTPYMMNYEDIAEPLFKGDYILFLMSDPSPWDEQDIFIEEIDISESPIFQNISYYDYWGYVCTACILNTDECDVEEAEQIVAALLTAEPGTSES